MINLEGTNECREFNITRDMTIGELKNELAKIYKIPADQFNLLLNEYPLQNLQLLSQAGIGNNLLTLRKIIPSSKNDIQLSQSHITPNQNIINNNLASSNQRLNQSQALLRSNYNNNMIKPNQSQSHISINPTPNINNINNNNPPLANSITANPELLGLSQTDILNDAIAYNTLFGSNMNNIIPQERMDEIMQRQRINDNFRTATEIMPESLFPVHMLYIHVEINKHKIAALIDTGAQSSFISANFCKKCGLMNLMDKRFQGIARGVGASRILGVIHAAEIKILNKVILARVNVIENNDVGFVLGLDNLRKYNCNVDLKKNGLVFPDIGITAKFLSDGEINKFKQEKEQTGRR
jgi:DNA damage-inducible protein 1